MASVALAFVGSWALLERTAGPNQLRDTPLYEAYGDAATAGDLPYRNYLLEYPPGAIAAFAAPDLTVQRERWAAYNRTFELWMAAFGVVMVGAVAATRRVVRGPGPSEPVAPLAVVAISPLLLGPVVLTRFDLFPAALTAAAIGALVARRDRLGAVLLGAAIATKLYPLVCLPFAIVFVRRRWVRAGTLTFSSLVVATAAAIFAPFAFLAPRGLLHAFVFQVDRPLQIESLGAAVLVAARRLGVVGPLTGSYDHNSSNFVGALPHAAGLVSLFGEVSLLGLALFLFARGDASPRRFLIACASAVATFVAFGKVFSPQYMIWLVPAVTVVSGRRSRLLLALLVLALILTHAWFPTHYLAYSRRFPLQQSLEVLARDLLVGAIAVIATLELRGSSGGLSGRSPRSGAWRRLGPSEIEGNGLSQVRSDGSDECEAVRGIAEA